MCSQKSYSVKKTQMIPLVRLCFSAHSIQ